MSAKQFASQPELEYKQIRLVELADGAYVNTAEGDPVVLEQAMAIAREGISNERTKI